MFEGENMNGKNIKMFLVDILLLIIFCTILLFNDYQSKKNLIENTKETQVYATVINKYTNIISTGKTFVKQYIIEVKFENNEKTHKIQISNSEYSSIEIGNEVFCTIYTTDDEIKDIELGKANEKIETYTFQDYLLDSL